MNTPDVTVTNFGTVWGFDLHTEEAQDFVLQRCQTEPWQWVGGTLMVDHRPARDIADYMQEEGLKVE